jgi:hypothetical protein
MKSDPGQRQLADLLTEALGPGRSGSLARALCQECLRETLEGPSPPRTFADLARSVESCSGGSRADRSTFLWTVLGIARAQPDLTLRDFVRDYLDRRGPTP